jgi:hypothetical protein
VQNLRSDISVIGRALPPPLRPIFSGQSHETNELRSKGFNPRNARGNRLGHFGFFIPDIPQHLGTFASKDRAQKPQVQSIFSGAKAIFPRFHAKKVATNSKNIKTP